MKIIEMTNGYKAIVDDCDYERLSAFKWYPAAQKDGSVYAVCRIRLASNKWITERMHRMVMGCSFGDGKRVDHINHRTLENVRNNLRLCTQKENARNMLPRGGVSQFKGVTYDPKKRLWRARISVDRKRIGLGRYKDEVKAAKAYDVAAQTYFGEFALLNFPNGGQICA